MSTCEVMALPAAGGVYYKGTVLDARVPPTAGLASPDELAAFDPWESVRVEWDVTARDEERIQVSLKYACCFAVQADATHAQLYQTSLAILCCCTLRNRAVDRMQTRRPVLSPPLCCACSR